MLVLRLQELSELSFCMSMFWSCLSRDSDADKTWIHHWLTEPSVDPALYTLCHECHDRPCDVWRCVTHCVTDHPHLWWKNERVMTMLWWNMVIIRQTTCAVTSWLGDFCSVHRTEINYKYKMVELEFETGLVLLSPADRKLRRFYLLITADLLFIQNDISRGL